MNRIHSAASSLAALLAALLAVALMAVAAPARALSHEGHEGHEGHGQPTQAADAAAPSSKDWIAAEVRRVDTAQQKLTLKHGDIRHLDMPGMTMPFRLAPGVVSAAQLSALKAGDRLEVRIESQQGALTIVELRPAPSAN